MQLLKTPIEYLKGVGPKRASLLKTELAISKYEDLLYYFPFRHIDKTQVYAIKDLDSSLQYIQLKGRVIRCEDLGHGKSKRFVVYFSDNHDTIKLVWFKGIRWIKSSLDFNKEYYVYGKPSYFNNEVNIVHPEIHSSDMQNNSMYGSMQGVYSTTEKLASKGLNSKGIYKLVNNLIPLVENDIQETLSEKIIQDLNLPTLKQALVNIHLPKDNNDLERARKRLKFDELFFLQLFLIKNKIVRKNKFKGLELIKIGDHFNDFYKNHLPFELTGAQKRVLKEIRMDVKGPSQMNRLIQGDVGSGKTLVAFLSMLMAVDNGFQSCIMAPTEILAQQHYRTILSLINTMDINVEILTGSTKNSKRKDILENLLNGKIDILIGTHAIIEDRVQFDNLSMVIIDEQHRFGVVQRSKLWAKNHKPPHILVMTATPIPRTLSMTLYGDLDISIIDELPPGRKEVKTLWQNDSNRLKVIGFIRGQINNGRQVYIVFPLIKESETLDYKNLMDGYDSLLRDFPLPEYQVSIVHGKMSNEDKEFEMKRFVEGITNIMVATTVIEVGVDIPNASVMIIESAERFGLSQLHQLRGRVGRGSEQSYCILMSGNKLSDEAKLRLQTMVNFSDGFKVSEVDLQIRGAGDMLGTKQSGSLQFKIADLSHDQNILVFARKLALKLLSEDEGFSKKENMNISRYFDLYSKERKKWIHIS